MEIRTKISDSLKKAEEFLLNDVMASEKTPDIKRCSSYHDIERYPDMCLPATYNATNALVLLGSYKNMEKVRKEALIDYFNSYQTEDGCYRFRRMADDEIWKGHSIEYSRAYIDNHVTNYTMGAIRNLGGYCRYPLSFIRKFETADGMKNWLNERDLTDPWLEGNNVVNLSSFLIYELEKKNPVLLTERMEQMFSWHEQYQDPETGFWGTNLGKKPAGIMDGMAGAAHNFHLYFYFNRRLKHTEKITDYCLEFINGQVKSACLDVDVVDILVNMIPYGYRTAEIKGSLEEFAEKLTAFQNADGGFADEKTNGVRRMDGWVGGYFEPQGLSNCFATWFRCTTLAMILCALSPSDADRFTFRNTIGIGYFNKEYLQ